MLGNLYSPLDVSMTELTCLMRERAPHQADDLAGAAPASSRTRTMSARPWIVRCSRSTTSNAGSKRKLVNMPVETIAHSVPV